MLSWKGDVPTKNKIRKNILPDFDKIQQALAAEWLERSKDEKPDDSDNSKNTKDIDPAF
ncbi:protein of unknown function [Ruminococcaceae bacterium BL-6]|nr:protein of unknown function [Ruminococcaceae bacterium BL-6]